MLRFMLLLLLGPALALPVAASYPAPVIKKVVVVGGTHGNEYTGVWCIKALDHRGEKFTSRYPSLDISTLLANPEAHLENKRFIHTDLNREFSENKLLGEEGMPNTIESLRAKELHELLGKNEGKFGVDLIIDLHSTTSNMGITVIIPEGDALMGQAAAWVAQNCNAKILMHSIPRRQERPNLSSAAKHGFTIEVGPVPQGVLRHDMVEKTEHAIEVLLEFLERRNKGEDMIGQLKQSFQTTVPCFRSAPAKQGGQLCGKIQWPSDKDNPNFPKWMIHKSLQDRDFHVIRKGDPMFVKLDGSVITYDGSHGDEVYLIFVNEGGYYYQSSGTGIGVAVQAKYDLDTGMLVEDECEES